MAGLLDFLGGNDPETAGAMDPRAMGLLGAAGAMGSAFTPQPASRLPLARPNMAYLLSQAAGGYGGGYGKGIEQQQLQAATQGQQIKNLNDVLTYNMWAPYLGQKPLNMPTPGGGGAMAPGSPAMAAGGQPGGGGMVVGSSAALTPPRPSAGAPAGPGAGAPGPAGGLPDMATMMRTLPPPVLQRMGITVPPEMNLLFAAGIGPGDPRYQNALDKVVTKGMGVNPVIGGERPGVPAQNFNMATNRYEPQPGTFDTMAQGAFTQAHAAGMGGLGPKESEAAFNAGLKIRTENTIEQNKAFYLTGQRPPDAMSGSAAMPIPSPNGDIGMPDGTIVPAPPKMTTFPGTDALNKQNTNTQETEKSFGAIRPTLEGTESRMVGLAKALQVVQSGGLNEKRAEVANILAGAGMPGPASIVMGAKDVAAVQTAMGLQTLDVLGQLKQINQGTGGRILNSEFTNLLDKQYGPDLTPQANFDLITQALGGIYQTKKMIDGYYKIAKPGGWRDANAYQSEFYSNPANSYQTMVDRAGKTIGPLKGMNAAPPPAAVKHLQMNPALAQEFDAKYGRGASAQFLGGK